MGDVISCESIFNQKLQEIRRKQKMNAIIAGFNQQYETEIASLAKMISETLDAASKNDN